MYLWLIWLVAAFLFGVGEIHARGLLLAPLAVGALVGRRALVVERIANDEGVGSVTIDGELWTARGLDDGAVIGAGEVVDVVAIRGATAVVMP